MTKPPICVLSTDGTNCGVETCFAYELAGGKPELVHVNQLREKSRRLKDYPILVIPGGFSYGDDVTAGKVLSTELIEFFKDELREHIARRWLILGICNGFQVLVRSGILPWGNLGKMEVTLDHNTSGHFQCQWVEMEVHDTRCIFTKGMEVRPRVEMQAAHGEGNFQASPNILVRLERRNQVVLRYVNENGLPDHKFNGSQNGIAGITDLTGQVLGLMPHPERFVLEGQHPNWRRRKDLGKPHGRAIFENSVAYAKQS